MILFKMLSKSGKAYLQQSPPLSEPDNVMKHLQSKWIDFDNNLTKEKQNRKERFG
jgi:hypothetical protein